MSYNEVKKTKMFLTPNLSIRNLKKLGNDILKKWDGVLSFQRYTFAINVDLILIVSQDNQKIIYIFI